MCITLLNANEWRQVTCHACSLQIQKSEASLLSYVIIGHDVTHSLICSFAFSFTCVWTLFSIQKVSWLYYTQAKHTPLCWASAWYSSFFLVVAGLGLHQPLLKDTLWWRSYYILEQWHMLCNPISGSITCESCMWDMTHMRQVFFREQDS